MGYPRTKIINADPQVPGTGAVESQLYRVITAGDPVNRNSKLEPLQFPSGAILEPGTVSSFPVFQVSEGEAERKPSRP